MKRDGIVLIFQELSLVMDLSVAENIYLGSLPMKGGRVDWKKLYADTQVVLDKLGCPASPKDPISSLPWISKCGFVDEKATHEIYNEYHDKMRISSPAPSRSSASCRAATSKKLSSASG